MHKKLEGSEIKPVLQQLDNEVSDALIAIITAKGIKYQLAAPYNHRLNPAKQVI